MKPPRFATVLACLTGALGTVSAQTESSIREAMTKAAQAPDWYPRVRAFYDALAPLPLADYPAAADRIDELKMRSPILGEMLGYWIERDVAGARAWIEAHAGKTFIYPEPVCESWVRVDLAGLVEWLNSSERAAQFSLGARRALFDGFAKDDPANAAEWSLKMPKPGPNHVCDEQEFFAEWARHDGAAAGARVLALPANDVRLNALKGVVSGWSGNDRAATARWIDTLDDPALRRQGTATLATVDQIRQKYGAAAPNPRPAPPAPAPRNPPPPELTAALAHASTMHVYHDYFALAARLGPEASALGLEAVWQQQGQRRVFKVLYDTYRSWAEKDFAAFRAHVEQPTDAETVSIARMVLLKQWRRMDEAAALAWADRLPAGERDNLLRSVGASAPKPSDPQQRIAQALGEPGKMGDLVSAFSDWAKTDPTAAATRALALEKPMERSMAVAGLLRGWAEKAPLDALAWVQARDAATRSEACAQFFDVWAARDLEAALTAAQSPAGEDLHELALARVAAILLPRDHDRALVLLETLPLRHALPAYLAWGHGDPAAAAPELARKLIATTARDRTTDDLMFASSELGDIVAVWTAKAPTAAAAFVLAQPDWLQKDLYRGLLETWSKSAPREAVEWLFALPDFEKSERQSALDDAIAGWATRSENEAIAWVENLPPHVKRDAATASLGRFLMPHRAEDALARMRTISDAKQRQRALFSAWIFWQATDRDGALRWLQSARLPPEERDLFTHGPKPEIFTPAAAASTTK